MIGAARRKHTASSARRAQVHVTSELGIPITGLDAVGHVRRNETWFLTSGVLGVTPRGLYLLGKQVGRKASYQSEGKVVSTEGDQEKGLGNEGLTRKD